MSTSFPCSNFIPKSFEKETLGWVGKITSKTTPSHFLLPLTLEAIKDELCALTCGSVKEEEEGKGWRKGRESERREEEGEE